MKPGDLTFRRYHVDLGTGRVEGGPVRCADLEDALGGIARGFKVLAEHRSAAPLVMNLGLLSGTPLMTGLRTFFVGYSPLKCSHAGEPGPMWSAGSGKLAVKLRALGVEEVVLTGRAAAPVLLRVTPGPRFVLEDAADLAGRRVNEKIQALHARYPDAHFAVIGPAGENYESVRYASIALSTENQLRSGDPKARYCGRGGFGGVMGSRNLLAVVADAPDPRAGRPSAELKRLNLEVARGDGSRRFRDRHRHGGGGGTWANCEALNPVHALPEYNFVPTGTEVSFPLHRPAVEQAGWEVRDEACHRCGIRCHKNIYDGSGFRAKLDYEPLVLLASNLGIFDVDAVCDLIVLIDDLGLDAISCGVTLSYAMEYNRRHPESPIADGLAYGDAAAAARVIEAVGAGRSELGQGTKRLSERLGESGYAMQCKGLEFPAYLPQTNPGYPFALAGGHMSLRTYLLLLFERETGLDYWVEAITERGPSIMRDDLLGACKFAVLGDEDMASAVREISGLDVTAGDLQHAVRRTYLRGYRLEREQGFAPEDYDMPAEVHEHYPQIELPHFNTKEFFSDLRPRVLARFDEMLEEEGL